MSAKRPRVPVCPVDVAITVPGRDRRAVAQALLDAAIDAEGRAEVSRSRTMRDYHLRSARTLRDLFNRVEP